MTDRIIMTYDDGPDPRHTSAVLDALQRHGATATFFLLMGRVRRDPGIVYDIVAAGHEVALHGLDHRRLTEMRPHAVWRRTRAGKEELEDMLGRRVGRFRPPYGKHRAVDLMSIRSLGLDVTLWGPSLLDWREATHAERMTAAMRNAGPGAIVLAHDGFAGPLDRALDGPPPDIDRGKLSGEVLSRYADEGWKAVSLSSAEESGGCPVRSVLRRV
jgi:peptidoglycan/xylan/chitin deacetylase (PgdA/CDA1 family)